MILTNSGVLKLMQRIKSFIATQLNTKASSVHTHSISEINDLASQLGGGGYSKSEVDTLLTGKSDTGHTHTKSQITDFPTIPSKTSDLTNDSGFLTSHQDLSGYIPKAGGFVFSEPEFSRTSNDSYLLLGGGQGWGNGASISLYGKNSTSNAGTILINATDNTNETLFFFRANGTIVESINNSTVKNVAMYEDVIPRGGGAVITGGALSRNINTSFLRIDGGSGWEQGSSIVVSGKDRTDAVGGGIGLHASNGTQSYTMSLRPDGTATWGNKNLAMQEDVIPRSGGAVLRGTELARTDATSMFVLCGGYNSNTGGNIVLYSNAFSSSAYQGAIGLYALTNGNTYKSMFLYPSGTWTWDGTACQITSDQRLKQQISEIDDKLLDAWEDVELSQFKYNDAVDQKGDNARLHTGYVVQQIDEACQKHNIDISEYGLYCHEEYPEETEEVEVENEDGTTSKETKVIREANEHYSLRYTETLVVECAYLRRENTRLKERLQQHEDYFSNIEKRLQSLENS